jgi:hypothetical protein
MTRFIIAALLICFLSPLTHIHAGNVKTTEGKQMPKDSVASLRLYEQKGEHHKDSVLFVFAVRIDTTTVSELLHGKKDDYSAAERPNMLQSDWEYDKYGLEFGEAYQLRTVNLAPGKHVLTVKCHGSFLRVKGIKNYFTEPFKMPLEAVAKHEYCFRVKYAEPDWFVTIEDRTAKTVVASIAVTAK